VTIVLIPTALRYSKYNEPSGFLVVYDSEKHKVLQKCEIVEPPYRKVDLNPRGGYRGLKGISIYGNSIAIANASTIFLYDNHWKPLRYIIHPTCAGFHDIFLESNSVWVTSARSDLLVKLDFFGNVIQYYDVRRFEIINNVSKREIKPFLSKKQIIQGYIDFRNPLSHDNAFTDALHVNSFAFLDNGELLISCGLVRLVENLFPHKINNKLKNILQSGVFSDLYEFYRKVVYKEKNTNFEATKITQEKSYSLIIKLSVQNKPSISLSIPRNNVPSHSIYILEDKSAVYLNTSVGEIVHFCPSTNEIYSSTKVGNHFLRGVCQLPDGSLLLGDNHVIVHYDLEKNKVISSTNFTDDTSEGVFDIKVLPKHFLLPPQSFPRHHNIYMPIDQTKKNDDNIIVVL